MADIDLKQDARLTRINGAEWSNGRRRSLGVPIAHGTLSQIMEIYKNQQERDRANCRLTITGGFHLDGAEIEDLIDSCS